MHKYKTSFVYVLAVLKTGIKEKKRRELVALCKQTLSQNSNPHYFFCWKSW